YGLFDHLREEGDKTGTYRIPDSVVFCACGAFEPAAAVSGMLSIPIQAIRSSSSRKDTEPKVLSEHQRSLELSIRGKEVIVVDDYTLTAGTLKRVMEAVNILQPRAMRGVSIGCAYPDNLTEGLKLAETGSCFKLYEMK
ncbi:MAG TPA: phosphoribosyltransferase family protein, partial [Candidatus Nanoarchaeia archaeon]|nr:phosphoribosyltransferase family protein [Candidatus Nanoarchaeia archaeon]